jgi:RNA polymerase sigma-70 factor (ECF subfamily)
MKEEELLEKIKNGEKDLYGIIIQKYNQRLYRIARSIVKNENELEDILQDTYLKAYMNLPQFRNESQFSTWLVRILINNANATVLKAKRFNSVIPEEINNPSDIGESPDFNMTNKELKQILEKAIDNLPENLRSVYIMREVENLSVSETSQCLGISEENVKTRLHRAKAILKDELYKKSKEDIELFRFGNQRCEKVTLAVMLQIGKLN